MRRLRDELRPDQYQVVRDNRTWVDHILRTYATAAMVAWFEPKSVADPACGDASIVRYADTIRQIDSIHLADISEPQMQNIKFGVWAMSRIPETRLYTGRWQETLSQMPHVDLMVLTEILEHLEDPEELLRAAREKAHHVVVSSPIDESYPGGNHEHVWSFSRDSYKELLIRSKWTPYVYQELVFTDERYPYNFQVWGCNAALP